MAPQRLTALLVLAIAAAAGQTPAFEFRELAPHVVAAVVDPDVPSYAFANTLVVFGEDGVLVVDTQQSPRPPLEVIREIRRRTDRPVRWVVATHAHADHVWGNQVYADSFPDARFIATAAARDSVVAGWDRVIAEQRAQTLERRGRLEEMLDGESDPDRRARIEAAIDLRTRYLDDLDGLRRVPFDRVVADTLRLDLGGREVLLVPVGPAHTPGDLVVHLPASGITAVGDLVEEGELWLEGADIPGWVDALDRVLALEPRIVLPGHGGVQTDLELVRAQRQELRALAERGR